MNILDLDSTDLKQRAERALAFGNGHIEIDAGALLKLLKAEAIASDLLTENAALESENEDLRNTLDDAKAGLDILKGDVEDAEAEIARLQGLLSGEGDEV